MADKCTNCATPCPWCQTLQCNGPQSNNKHCAGPYVYTGEDTIGCRECCGGLKKCSDRWGIRQWCSHTGTCPGGFDATASYPPAPIPFRSYSNIIVPKIQENFPTGKRGTYSSMRGL